MSARDIVSGERNKREAVTLPRPVDPAGHGEQVLAGPSVGGQVFATTDQGLTSVGAIAAGVVSTLVSNRDTATQDPSSPRPTLRGRKSKAQEKSGGWQPSPRLGWTAVKQIDDSVHWLKRLGFAPTHCITIMPPTSITEDNKRKRLCVGKVAHIGEALKRHRTLHIGLTVFENPTNADLHAHHLAHVPDGERETIERFHNPPVVHVQQIYDLRGTVAYVTKQRQRLPPDFERGIKRPWQRSLPVPGKRWTMTLSARAMLAGSPSIPTVGATADSAPPPRISKPTERPSVPVQLALTLAAPVIDLFALAEEKRKAEGIPQHKLASRLGIRQAQYSNAVVRRHDPLSSWARNRLREFVADQLVA